MTFATVASLIFHCIWSVPRLNRSSPTSGSFLLRDRKCTKILEPKYWNISSRSTHTSHTHNCPIYWLWKDAAPASHMIRLAGGGISPSEAIKTGGIKGRHECGASLEQDSYEGMGIHADMVTIYPGSGRCSNTLDSKNGDGQARKGLSLQSREEKDRNGGSEDDWCNHNPAWCSENGLRRPR